MKKTILFVALIQLVNSSTLAAGEPWSKSIDMGLNLTQNSYSDSWTGGEAGNISWVSKADAIFEKQFSPKFNFKNISKLQFGQTHTQDKETKVWARPTKSTDKIDIENLGRITLDTYVDPYIAFRIESQFLDASYDPLKRYINPILLTESAGVARMLYEKEKDQILSRLGFSVRQSMNKIIVDTTAETFETETSSDGGIESVSDIHFVFSERLNYIGKLSLFKALFYSEKDAFIGTPAEDYWKAVDVNFESTISASVTKYVVVTLYAQLLYDKQVDLRGRFKETLALGLTYKFL
ncbi:MAG: DUF3078 domain-containing protein [candidate division Zixibacteria bacterium]